MRSVLGNHELSTTDHWSAFTVAAVGSMGNARGGSTS